jgi:hypothetical protein
MKLLFFVSEENREINVFIHYSSLRGIFWATQTFQPLKYYF